MKNSMKILALAGLLLTAQISVSHAGGISKVAARTLAEMAVKGGAESRASIAALIGSDAAKLGSDAAKLEKVITSSLAKRNLSPALVADIETRMSMAQQIIAKGGDVALSLDKVVAPALKVSQEGRLAFTKDYEKAVLSSAKTKQVDAQDHEKFMKELTSYVNRAGVDVSLLKEANTAAWKAAYVLKNYKGVTFEKVVSVHGPMIKICIDGEVDKDGKTVKEPFSVYAAEKALRMNREFSNGILAAYEKNPSASGAELIKSGFEAYNNEYRTNFTGSAQEALENSCTLALDGCQQVNQGGIAQELRRGVCAGGA